VVAHDRALLSAATDQWLLVADGEVKPFEGDLDDYKQWAREYQLRGTRFEVRGGAPALSRKEEKRIEAQERQRQAELRRPFEKKIAAIESEMEPLTREAADAEAWLAGSDAYQEPNRERLQETLKRRAEVAQRIAKLEDDWLWAQAEMEKAVK
jgi:ATP-binding cassette subfamily F protein 3